MNFQISNELENIKKTILNRLKPMQYTSLAHMLMEHPQKIVILTFI